MLISREEHSDRRNSESRGLEVGAHSVDQMKKIAMQ